MADKIATLREPPVVGRYYLVPTVEYYWLGRMSVWPVNGPIHHDREIGFPQLHYHIDARFLTRQQLAWLDSYDAEWSRYSSLNGRPMSEIAEQRWSGLKASFRPLPRRPMLRKRKCIMATYAWTVPADLTKGLGLEARYPEPKAILKADGRELCPHRKVDLSQFPTDADGLKTCPIHGLRVDCRRLAA
jgi:hypothetical protein